MFESECDGCSSESSNLKYDPDVDKKLCPDCMKKLNESRKYEYEEPSIQRYGYN